MDYFSIVEDAHVLLFSRGVYRQAKVYVRDGRLYAAQGSGFIRLNKDQSTTVPQVRWLEIDSVKL